MLEILLYETRFGEWLLTQFEQKTGLAIVKAEWLGKVSPVLATPGQDGHKKGASPCPETVYHVIEHLTS